MLIYGSMEKDKTTKLNLQSEDLISLSNGFEYASIPKDSFVLKYGDHNKILYIVLSGKVSVWEPMTDA